MCEGKEALRQWKIVGDYPTLVGLVGKYRSDRPACRAHCVQGIQGDLRLADGKRYDIIGWMYYRNATLDCICIIAHTQFTNFPRATHVSNFPSLIILLIKFISLCQLNFHQIFFYHHNYKLKKIIHYNNVIIIKVVCKLIFIYKNTC